MAYSRNNLIPRFPVSVAPHKARSKLIELLGLSEIPNEVDYTKYNSSPEEGVCLTDLSFTNSLGEKVPAILMEPLNAGDNLLPGVVCIDGTGGTAERLANNKYYMENQDRGPLFGWGRELAKRGFITLGITPKGCELRRQSEEAWAIENKHLAPFGISQMGLLVEESLRAVNILSGQNRVISNNVGLTGMSLGGNAAWYAMACAPWLKTAVPICGGVGKLTSVINECDGYRHSAYYYIPHMLRFFDHPQIVANCIAPRPFMLVAPTEDEDMPKSGVDDLKKFVTPVYSQVGQTENFHVYQPKGTHCFKMEYFDWMVDWFNHFLNESKTNRA